MKCTNNNIETVIIDTVQPPIDVMYYSPFRIKAEELQEEANKFKAISKQLGHIPLVLMNDLTVKYNLTLKELQEYKEWIEHIIKCYEDGRYNDL